MQVTLKKPWAAFEAAKNELILALSEADSSLFNQSPAPDQWSVNQVILHLIQVEKASLAYIQKQQIKGHALEKVTWKTYYRYALLRFVFALPLKFKAPAGLGTLPTDLNTASLLQEWHDLRLSLRHLVENLTIQEVNAALWRHPQAGKLSVEHMLRFLVRHLERHRQQIDRLLAGF